MRKKRILEGSGEEAVDMVKSIDDDDDAADERERVIERER